MKRAMATLILFSFLVVGIAMVPSPMTTLATPNKESGEPPTTCLTKTKTMCFVATTNVSDAKKFYGDVLGLRFLHDDQYGLMYEVGSNQLLRVQVLKELQLQPFTIFGWEADDIEATVKELGERGVKFEHFGFPTQAKNGICTFPNGDQVAWFKDPQGNTLSIAQIVR